jgi:hypothetical protein
MCLILLDDDEALGFVIDIFDSALRNACHELNARKGNSYRGLVIEW